VQPANQIPVRLSRFLGLAVGGAVIAALAVPRVAQDPAYHLFADTRPLLGIPNSLNVLSNLPFALVGLAGLVAVARMRAWERWPYGALFAGVALTSIGSAYYHLSPDNWTLVWDRLPMTVGFMGLLTAVLSERVSSRVARTLFVPLLVFGAASVAYWYQTTPSKPFPPLPTKEERIPKPEVSAVDIHRWRDSWRQSRGGGLQYGNEV